MTSRLLLAIGVAGLLVARTHAQSPAQTFRTNVDLVDVDVSVVDGSGTSVPGLTQADFEVFEDGTPQKIVAFSQRRAKGNQPVAEA